MDELVRAVDLCLEAKTLVDASGNQTARLLLDTLLAELGCLIAQSIRPDA